VTSTKIVLSLIPLIPLLFSLLCIVARTSSTAKGTCGRWLLAYLAPGFCGGFSCDIKSSLIQMGGLGGRELDHVKGTTLLYLFSWEFLNSGTHLYFM
jgi:hypothetical protein